MTEEPADKHASRTDRLFAHINSQSPLEVLLRGHLWIEQEMTAAIRTALPVPEALEEGGHLQFALRLRLVTALGLLPLKEAPAYRGINSLRNKIAHSSEAEIGAQHVNDLVNTLGPVGRRVYNQFLTNKKVEGLADDDWLERLRMIIAILFMFIEHWRTRLSEFAPEVRGDLARYVGEAEPDPSDAER